MGSMLLMMMTLLLRLLRLVAEELRSRLQVLTTMMMMIVAVIFQGFASLLLQHLASMKEMKALIFLWKKSIKTRI